MVSDLEKVRLLLAEVFELSKKQFKYFEENRLVEMLECQKDRAVIFNELSALSLDKYVEEPMVRQLVDKVLLQNKDLNLNIETTIEEHKQKVSSIQKGSAAMRAYSESR